MRNSKSDSSYQQALDSLTRFLAHRDHSRLELRQKLSKRFELELVDKLLDEAEARGLLLPEEAMAERAMKALQRKQKSSSYIEGALLKRGLPVPPRDLDGELASARTLLARKFGEEKLSFEERAKATRFLQYRGFNDLTIRQVLDEER